MNTITLDWLVRTCAPTWLEAVARDAARAAATKPPVSVVATLQQSAFGLFDRMCALGEDSRREAR